MKVAPPYGKERRKDRRIRLRPIVMVIDGEPYVTMEWGFGGFSVEAYKGEKSTGDMIEVGIVVNDGEKDVEHVTKAKIVRIEASGKMAAAFGTLDIRIVSFLDAWLTGRLAQQKERQRQQTASG